MKFHSFSRNTRAYHRLAAHIRKARRRCGWVQQDLALQIGVSVSTVRRLERGDPGVALSLVLCGALRLGLLREFNQLLECRPGQHGFGNICSMRTPTGTLGTGSDVYVNARLVFPPEVQMLLPQGQCGARLTDHLTLSICIDDQTVPFGELRHRDASNGNATFTYDPSWLQHKRFFAVSPELRAIRSRQRGQEGRAGHREVFGALAVTAPAGFGALVLERARCLGLLDALRPIGHRPSPFDGLCVVLDIARLGALRVAPYGQPLSDAKAERFLLPVQGDLNGMADAVRAFEQGTEDLRQLLLLLYATTALGGERPKSAWFDSQGRLALAKFGSVSDTWAVNRGEVLAMHLAKEMGIDVVDVKLLNPVNNPILVALRLDRSERGGRIPFLSARSLLPTDVSERVGHLDLLQVMRRSCRDFKADGVQLWKRLVLKCLIHDTSDDMCKIGFVYAGDDRWRLAPAYGLRPRPPSEQAVCGSQALSADHRVTLAILVEQASAFGINPAHVRPFLRHQLDILTRWKRLASEFFVHMNAQDIRLIEPAMNNSQTAWARQFVAA